MTAATAKPTTAMQAHAQVLLERAATWARGERKDGLRFYLFASSRTLADGTPIYHMTRADALAACTCPSWLHRGQCSHVEAVRLFNARQQQSSTTWRECSRRCGELLPPEHLGKICDHCWQKARRLLDSMGED